jgi:tetratricopeptide (TPR) repeat protein
MSLNPNDSDILVEYGYALAYSEQPERGVELLQKAMRLNPYRPDWYLWCLADAYDTMGRSEDVIATVRRMHDPSEGQRLLAANFAHLGMMRQAEEERVKSCGFIPDSRSANGASAFPIATKPRSSASLRAFARPACRNEREPLAARAGSGELGSPRNKRRPRERGSRRADERAKAVHDGGAEAGRAVAVERHKLCAKVAHDERRDWPLPVATRIV